MKQTTYGKAKKILLILLAVLIVLCAVNIVVRLVIRKTEKQIEPITETTLTADQVTAAQVTNASTTTAVTAAAAPTTAVPTTAALQMSTQEILSLVRTSFEKTRNYQDDLEVMHSEDFEFEIKEITGGEPVKALSNVFIQAVLSPQKETLNYKNGKATDSDGEELPILLPDSNDFSLPDEACQSVSAKRNGDDIVVNIRLVPETASYPDMPKYNAGAFGYVDFSKLSLPGVTPERIDYTYPQTDIEYVIGSDGFIRKATYTAQLTIDGNGKLLLIDASLKSGGTLTEVWELNW
ncbi:MAG: hypothetical protein K6G90_04690 [Clostridia bacterium]|nr:hypothetical protein [Clostridia bacterium]